MAKKTRRARKRQKGRQSRPNIPPPAPAGVSAAKQQRAVKPPERIVARTATDFSEQYAYVRQDLKRIGLLAGTMFAALIALSFFLR